MTARLFLFLLLLGLATPLAAQGPFDPFGKARIDERTGARVPLDAPFLDADGRSVTLRRLAGGRPILLVPVLHDCPNLCGVTLAGLADAIAAQPLRSGRDFVTIAFGIDPREGPAAAAGDLARLRMRDSGRALAGVAALVGREKAIRAVTDAIGYRYAWDDRIGQYAHVAATAVLTPDGRLSGWLYGLTPAPAALRQAIDTARAGRKAPWTEPLLLLCYHYDPVTGRYTPAIENILRLAALLTLLGLGVLLLRLRRRAR